MEKTEVNVSSEVDKVDWISIEIKFIMNQAIDGLYMPDCCILLSQFLCMHNFQGTNHTKLTVQNIFIKSLSVDSRNLASQRANTYFFI